MFRLILGGFALATMFAAGPAEKYQVVGRGGMKVEHDDDHGGEGHPGGNGVMVVIDVTQGDKPTGKVLFAGDVHTDHGYYPALLVKMERFEEFKVIGNKVTLRGTGQYNEDLAHVEMVIEDGRGKKPDFVHIEARTLDGHKHFHTHGNLITGDIKIEKVKE